MFRGAFAEDAEAEIAYVDATEGVCYPVVKAHASLGVGAGEEDIHVRPVDIGGGDIPAAHHETTICVKRHAADAEPLRHLEADRAVPPDPAVAQTSGTSGGQSKLKHRCPARPAFLPRRGRTA